MKFAVIDELAFGVSSANAAKLMNDALRAMVKAQLKSAAMVVLGIGLMAGVGTGVLARVHQPIAANHAPAQRQSRPILSDAPQPAGRVLRFPVARALGIIYYVQDERELDRAHLQYTATEPWRRLGEARGEVRLPEKGLIRLDLSKAALDDLSSLEKLAPDALHALRLDHLGGTMRPCATSGI